MSPWQAVVWALLLTTACGGEKPAGAPAPGEPSEIRQARELLASGHFDDVLARLKDNASPDAIYLQAEAWARKAEMAPLPTPDTVGFAPELKPEELEAIALYEKAAARLPQDPRPRQGLATLLTPHAQRRYDADQAGRKAPVEAAGPDFSPTRVAAEYKAAAELAPSKPEALEALYAFALRVGQLDAAEWALQARIQRENENPDHLLRYGDFLRDVKKQPLDAVGQYRQVLIWRADDEAVKARIADIYMDLAALHHARGELATADARYQDAQKWIADQSSERYLKLERELARVRRAGGRVPQ